MLRPGAEDMESIYTGSDLNDPGADGVTRRFLISTDSQFLVIWIAGHEKVRSWEIQDMRGDFVDTTG